MAITNAMIIFNAQQQLFQEGKLKPTGRMLKFETADGAQEVPEVEDIHTFQRWKVRLRTSTPSNAGRN